MRQRIQRPAALALALTVTAAACSDDFFTVTDPDVLEESVINPQTDGPVLARSAFQNFATAFSTLAVYSAWWSHEARVGDTFPTRNEFGRRFLDDTNGTLNTETWAPITRAASTSAQTAKLVENVPDLGLPLTLAAFSEAYALLIMAEAFCEGTVAEARLEPGPRLTTDQLLTRAIERFTVARAEAQKLLGSEPAAIATASLVGMARAHLFAGRKAAADSVARLVPASFVYELPYLDDPANRARVGNAVWTFSQTRQSLVVPPEYRAMADAGDPRIKYEDTGRLAQDSELRFYRQLKFPTWGESIRLASGLEARYIAAEASSNIAEQLALINERRAVGKQTPFASADPDAVLRELLEQRARDFWLEGQKMGDYRRNPGKVPYFLADGSTYYKPGVGDVGTQNCWPVPDAEKRHNPNWN